MSRVRILLGVLLLLALTASPVAAGHSSDLDCPDLEGRAQAHWDEHGYTADNDPERLDADDDGIPCEDPNDDEEMAAGGGGDDDGGGDMPRTDTVGASGSGLG